MELIVISAETEDLIWVLISLIGWSNQLKFNWDQAPILFFPAYKQKF